MLAARDLSQSVLRNDDRDQLAKLPILVLNAHSRCNCRCVMCDIWKRDGADEVTAADLERHRESLLRLQVEWVVISGGEPLMHSDLHALCSFFHALNIRLTLLTTGLLLQRRAQEIASDFDDVIVSLDGPREIHENIRRIKGGFELIHGGIVDVRKLRPEMRITARCTVQKMNHAHLRRTVSTAKELKLNGISFLAADLTSEAFNRPLLWPGQRQSEIGLCAEEIEALAHEVEELITVCADDISEGYIAESPAKLRRIVRHFRAHQGQVSLEAPTCNAPWVSAVVEADGSVRPCFFHRTIGNLQHDSLDNIINGEAARNFRRQLDIAGNPVCRQCVCSLYRPDCAREQL